MAKLEVNYGTTEVGNLVTKNAQLGNHREANHSKTGFGKAIWAMSD